MEHVNQLLTATLTFLPIYEDGIPDEQDRRGWWFTPDRAEVEFQVVDLSWVPLFLDLSGTVCRKDGSRSTVRRHRVWGWDRVTARFADLHGKSAPEWAMRWVKSVQPTTNPLTDPRVGSDD